MLQRTLCLIWSVVYGKYWNLNCAIGRFQHDGGTKQLDI